MAGKTHVWSLAVNQGVSHGRRAQKKYREKKMQEVDLYKKQVSVATANKV